MKRGRKKGVVCLKLIQMGIRICGSQSKLALALGVTRQTVSAWVLKKARPSRDCHLKLLKVSTQRGNA